MKINIASALDDNYIRYTYIMMMSAIENKYSEDDMVFYILYKELSDDNIEMLRSLDNGNDAKVVFIKVDFSDYSEGLYTDEKWTEAIYYRLMLSNIMPADVDRLLYLDGDIIVNKPLNDLYGMDFEGFLLIGCEDYMLRTSDNLSEIQRASLEENLPYICSGVILYDFENYRKKYSISEYIAPLKGLDIDFEMPDQDLINLVHAEEIKLVDKHKYNLFPKQAFNEGYTYGKIKEEVTIVHFATQKPWKGQFVHCETEQIWWDYAVRAPFFESLSRDYIYQVVNNPYVYEKITDLLLENKRLKDELSVYKEFKDKVLLMLGEQEE